MDPEQKQPTSPQDPPRGAFIHIPVEGNSIRAELVGITPLELYAALSIILEKLRKNFE